jgi:hypothetical protein
MGLWLAQLGAVLIALGGLGDQAVQKLMPSHEAFLGIAPGAAPRAFEQLFLAAVHALGCSLMAVGLGAFVLLRVMAATGRRWLGAVVVVMVLLSDGVNAFQMERTGSPAFLAPLAFVVVTTVGVALYALGSRRAREG